MSSTEISAPESSARSVWLARAGALLVLLFPLALFAMNLGQNTESAFLGIVASVAFAFILFKAWPMLATTVDRDYVLLSAIVIYVIFGLITLDKFSQYPWSGYLGLVGLVVMVGTVTATWKETRKAPPTAKIGLCIIFINIMVVCLAPLLTPYEQSQVLGSSNQLWGTELRNGATAWLGTDELGRDYLARLIHATRNTVGIAIVATALTFIVGSLVGLLAATLRGWVDQLLSRIVDVLMAIPPLIFALLILTVVGTGIWKMVLVIALLDSTRVFRLARSVAMNIVVMDYVEAAKLRGEGLWYVIWREVLPNAAAPLIAEFGLRFCFVFLFISALSFLGLGLQPPLADLGSMVRDSANLINFFAYSKALAIMPLLPAFAIALLTVGVNFVVDWFLHKTSGLKE